MDITAEDTRQKQVTAQNALGAAEYSSHPRF